MAEIAETERVIESTCVARPASRYITFSIVNIPDDVRRKFERWKWVNVWDLFECANAFIGSLGSTEIFRSPEDMLAGYMLVNKKEMDRGLSTWVTETAYGLHSDQAIGPGYGKQTFIPEPWSSTIIELAEQGVIKVVAAPAKMVGNMPIYDLEACFSGGRRHWLHWQGFDRYKIID